MIDVNQITSTLRSMPDRQLQQYAAMHKGDPYILSLAVAESNQRKQLRTAAQGQAGAQPMPKVADQDIAAMAPAQQLPEQQGIGQLPAPNMQHMADGGIAGYGDDANEGMAAGGSMFDFAQRSEPVLRMAGGGHVPRYQGNTTDGSVVSSNPMFNIPGMTAVTPRADFTQAGAPENQTLWEQFSGYMGNKKKQALLDQIAFRINNGIATPEEVALYNSEKIKAGDKAAAEAKYPSNMATRAKNFPGPSTELTNTGIEPAAAKDKAPADKPPVPPVVNIPAVGASTKEAQALGDKFFNLKDVKGMIEQNQMQERQDITNEKDARVAALEAFNKAQGPAMAGYEKLLKQEEMQDATDKEKAGLMALMKGFLGMAAGESPNAATNIAKGAMVGLGDYGDAIKEFRKSAKERNKAMATIEEARRADAKGDFKTVQDAEDKANDYLRASRQSGIKAIMDATGKNAEISSSIYKTMLENSGAMARTVAQINAPDAQSKFFGNVGGGDIKKGLGYYAEVMGPEAKGEQALLAKYAGPQGEIALKMLEQSGPEGKLQAQLIRQKLSAAMLSPTNKPTGQVLVGQ
jgi:hypothetical protein